MEEKPTTSRKGYASDVNEAEWEFCQPYLTLMSEQAPQRLYSLREIFDTVRYIIRTGCQWGLMPHDLPPWQAGVSANPPLDASRVS